MHLSMRQPDIVFLAGSAVQSLLARQLLRRQAVARSEAANQPFGVTDELTCKDNLP
jgi:hypothetical protein